MPSTYVKAWAIAPSLYIKYTKGSYGYKYSHVIRYRGCVFMSLDSFVQISKGKVWKLWRPEELSKIFNLTLMLVWKSCLVFDKFNAVMFFVLMRVTLAYWKLNLHIVIFVVYWPCVVIESFRVEFDAPFLYYNYIEYINILKKSHWIHSSK